jgi:antitoxin component YwqK of YwqJK toxin-antitoxin module
VSHSHRYLVHFSSEQNEKMIRVGRPILIALICLFSTSVFVLRDVPAQTFTTPQIPSGRTLGDIGGSSSRGGAFVPSASPDSGSIEGQTYNDKLTVPRFDTSAGEVEVDPGTTVFGPVDGAVPTISPELPSNNETPSSASMKSGGRDFEFSGAAPTRATRETSARRSKADIGEMPGRDIVRQRYPDGNVQIARHVKQDQDGNFINDGQWQLFDREGVRIAMGTYVGGAMDGQWARLHLKSDGGIFLNPPFSLFQGPFKSLANFSEGKITGRWRIMDAKGQKVFEMPYQNGKRDGLAVWFYPGEKIYRRMQFADNVPHGQLVQFDQRGRITRKEVYQDGRRIENRVTYYRPGNQKQEAKIILRGRVELNGEDQWWDAKPAELVVTGEDTEQGPIRSWYQNGQAKMIGNLEEGLRVGRFVWWHENGVKQSMGSYDAQGNKVGQWTWWHKNGMKSIVGQYKDDQPDGLWRQWDENGVQTREKTFDADAASIDLFGAEDADVGESIDFDSGEDGSMQSMLDDNDATSESNEDRERGSKGTESLEDISPVEMEGEKLPSPADAKGDDSSVLRLQGPLQTTDQQADKFFQIGF